MSLWRAQEAGAQQLRLFIEVRSSQIRLEPKHWARTVRQVAYGDSVLELSREQAWIKVKSEDGSEGYLHSSAVTTRAVILASTGNLAGAQSSGSDSTDVVLAGKGFSSDVEKLLATSRSQLNFAEVDALERLQVSDAALERFLAGGELGGLGG